MVTRQKKREENEDGLIDYLFIRTSSNREREGKNIGKRKREREREGDRAN